MATSRSAAVFEAQFNRTVPNRNPWNLIHKAAGDASTARDSAGPFPRSTAPWNATARTRAQLQSRVAAHQTYTQILGVLPGGNLFC